MHLRARNCTLSRTLEGVKAPAIAVNGAYVRALRDAHGYTVNTFAEAVRTSASNMSRIESGRRQPAPDLRLRMAANLRIPLVALRDQEAFEKALNDALRKVIAT